MDALRARAPGPIGAELRWRMGAAKRETAWEAGAGASGPAPPSSGAPVLAAKLRVPRADSLPRERLDDLLRGAWSRRLGLVVAPAGSGKTTLLARFAASAAVPVAWYRPETWDGAVEVFLGYLEAALRSALGDLAAGWRTVEDAARALEAWPGDRALVVVDDLHVLEGTPAEAAFERLLDYAPSLLFLAASRTQPRINLSRLRVAGHLLEIGGDDLRFRSWEVERLFRDFYQDPLPPVELAKLARRTEGWAAGLQLFHLATRGKAQDDRRRVLEGLSGGSRYVREYLARNVLAELPAELSGFLVDTCVLQRLSGPICDRLLERRNSGLLLEELERRQVFTQALDDEGHYRYHEVLRSHLESVLVRELGEAAVVERYRRAGAVLEEAGALAEALHVHGRAGDWAGVDRLRGRAGEQVLQGSQLWIDALPAGVLAQDPWLLLGTARRHRADGLWEAALDAYQLAEHALGAAEATQAAGRERQALAAWVVPGSRPPADLLGLLRVATQRSPAAARAQAGSLGGPAAGLLAGLCALLAGEVLDARRLLATAAADPALTGGPAVAARLGLGIAGLLAGDVRAAQDVRRAAESAEIQGLGFLTRLGHAGRALEPDADPDPAAAARFACERIGDGWGAALAGLLEGWVRLQSVEVGAAARAAAILGEASEWFERTESPPLRAWADSVRALALARVRDPEAAPLALRAARLALACGCEGAALLADAALAAAEGCVRPEHAAAVSARRAVTGIAARWTPLEPLRPAVDIRLFGGFRLEVDGVPRDLAALKPRVRMLLRLLAVQGGRPLHREAIQVALWPEAPVDSAARNLHVAVSSLRQALEPGVARGSFALVVRDGDAYRLAAGPDVGIDLVAFEEDLSAARRAQAAGDAGSAIRDLE